MIILPVTATITYLPACVMGILEMIDEDDESSDSSETIQPCCFVDPLGSTSARLTVEEAGYQDFEVTGTTANFRPNPAQ